MFFDFKLLNKSVIFSCNTKVMRTIISAVTIHEINPERELPKNAERCKNSTNRRNDREAQHPEPNNLHTDYQESPNLQFSKRSTPNDQQVLQISLLSYSMHWIWFDSHTMKWNFVQYTINRFNITRILNLSIHHHPIKFLLLLQHFPWT